MEAAAEPTGTYLRRFADKMATFLLTHAMYGNKLKTAVLDGN